MVTSNRVQTDCEQSSHGTDSPLADIVIGSASQLVSRLLEAEVEEFVSNYAQLSDSEGKPRVVRNGYLPERKVKTALGRVPVRIPRVRDRLKNAGADRIKFNSKIIAPYQRRTSVRGQFVHRFLSQLSKADFVEAAAILLGTKRQFVTPAIADKLKNSLRFCLSQPHNFATKQFRCFWVDRVCEEVTASEAPLIVVTGETELGEKQLLLIMEERGRGLNIYESLIEKLAELGVSGEGFVSLAKQPLAN